LARESLSGKCEPDPKVQGAPHGPGPDDLALVEGRIHLGHGGPRDSETDGPLHPGKVLALQGQHEPHGFLGGFEGRTQDPLVGDAEPPDPVGN